MSDPIQPAYECTDYFARVVGLAVTATGHARCLVAVSSENVCVEPEERGSDNFLVDSTFIHL